MSVNENDEIITEFKLEQNYPNPFNPSTTIKYSIPNFNLHVVAKTTRRVVSTKLIVYDILGHKIVTLVNKQRLPGNYEVIFNASSINGGLPSGIYFYRLIINGGNEYIRTMKMVLLE